MLYRLSRFIASSLVTSLLLFSWLPNYYPAFTPAQTAQSNPVASNDRDRGIQLFQKGDSKGAVESLKAAIKQDKRDGDAWHYLGLALADLGDKNAARKAFENAANLRIDNVFEAHYTNPPASDEERVTRRQEHLALLKSALDSLEHYITLTPKPTSEWRMRLDNLRAVKEDYEQGAKAVLGPSEVTTKARIVTKPEPIYTEDARDHGVVGTIVLRAVFAFDGTVRNITVVRGLTHGLNEKPFKLRERSSSSRPPRTVDLCRCTSSSNTTSIYTSGRTSPPNLHLS